MKIIWNEVTKLSQIAAIALFLAVFALAFSLGMKYSSSRTESAQPLQKTDSAAGGLTVYECAEGKSVWAAYKDAEVTLSLSSGSNITLPLAMSASGARYANEDDSFVFWNKGKTAFIQENASTTYSDCTEKSI